VLPAVGYVPTDGVGGTAGATSCGGPRVSGVPRRQLSIRRPGRRRQRARRPDSSAACSKRRQKALPSIKRELWIEYLFCFQLWKLALAGWGSQIGARSWTQTYDQVTRTTRSRISRSLRFPMISVSIKISPVWLGAPLEMVRLNHEGEYKVIAGRIPLMQIRQSRICLRTSILHSECRW
jgi:hypothetical protein